MRKLLIFMLVLGMASAAHAAIANPDAIIQITVNGIVYDDTEVKIHPSDIIELDIDVAPGWGVSAFDLDLEIIGPGHIDLDLSNAVVNETVASWSLGYALYYDETGIQQYAGAAFFLIGEPDATGTLLSGLIFHCDDTPDVLLKITVRDMLNLTDPDGLQLQLTPAQAEEYVGQLIIHQPEPMTIALLGLGGLLLRRRK